MIDNERIEGRTLVAATVFTGRAHDTVRVWVVQDGAAVWAEGRTRGRGARGEELDHRHLLCVNACLSANYLEWLLFCRIQLLQMKKEGLQLSQMKNNNCTASLTQENHSFREKSPRC